MNDVYEKIAALEAIYQGHENAVAPYKADAVCKPGCSFCCTAPRIDATTLEGFVIWQHLQKIPKAARETLTKRLRQDCRNRAPVRLQPCPFLLADQTCRIYAVRPFSCRQLYSVEKCGDRGPVLHRPAVAAARKTVGALQQLDDNGYSGHISFILQLLGKPDFRNLYCSGGFHPERIRDFGKSHGIIIHRGVSGPPDP